MCSACDFTVLPADICNRSPGFSTGSCRLLPGSTGTSEQPWSNHGHDRLWLMNDRPAIPDRAAALPPGPGSGYGLLFLLVAGESGLVVSADCRHTIPLMHRSRRPRPRRSALLAFLDLVRALPRSPGHDERGRAPPMLRSAENQPGAVSNSPYRVGHRLLRPSSSDPSPLEPTSARSRSSCDWPALTCRYDNAPRTQVQSATGETLQTTGFRGSQRSGPGQCNQPRPA